MRKIQNDQISLPKTFRLKGFIAVFTLLLLSVTVSSCSAIAEIFKAGMGFGIFMVLAVLVVITFIIYKFRKRG